MVNKNKELHPIANMISCQPQTGVSQSLHVSKYIQLLETSLDPISISTTPAKVVDVLNSETNFITDIKTNQQAEWLCPIPFPPANIAHL